MKAINYNVLILSVIIIFALSCSSSSNFGKKISGKWFMVKVMELSKDVTASHNPNNNRWISFKADKDFSFKGSFESGTGEERENTGKWFYDDKTKEFFLDSDAGEDDDSYWEVSFNADSMYWKGKKFEFNKRFEIFYKKA
jgi:hypothetical protein